MWQPLKLNQIFLIWSNIRTIIQYRHFSFQYQSVFFNHNYNSIIQRYRLRRMCVTTIFRHITLTARYTIKLIYIAQSIYISIECFSRVNCSRRLFCLIKMFWFRYYTQSGARELRSLMLFEKSFPCFININISRFHRWLRHTLMPIVDAHTQYMKLVYNRVIWLSCLLLRVEHSTLIGVK